MDKFGEDLELVRLFAESKELLAGEDNIFVNVNVNDYPVLSRRENSPNSRNLVANHLRNTLYVSFIKDLYEETTEYLHYAYEQAILNTNNVDRLIKDERFIFKIEEVLSKSTKTEMTKEIKRQIVQQFEKRSTLYLICNIEQKMNFRIQRATINAAMPYLECRHLFVHADGLANQDFRQKYPNIRLRSGKIELDATFISTARDTVSKLLKAIDNKMLSNTLFPLSEQQP